MLNDTQQVRKGESYSSCCLSFRSKFERHKHQRQSLESRKEIKKGAVDGYGKKHWKGIGNGFYHQDEGTSSSSEGSEL